MGKEIWVRYNNDYSIKKVIRDLSLGMILVKKYGKYSSGKCINEEMIKDLPEEVEVRYPIIKIGSMLRSRFSNAVAKIVSINGTGKSRTVDLLFVNSEPPYRGPFRMSAPEFRKGEYEKHGYLGALGDLYIYNVLSVDLTEDVNKKEIQAVLGFEPEDFDNI